MWTMLSDNFYDNPKIDAAGNAAAGVFVKALSYCGRYSTDGFLSTVAARKLGSGRELEAVTCAELWQAVAAGETHTVTGRKDSGGRKRADVVFVAPSDGYWIAGYPDRNPTREEYESLADKRREAANTRWHGHASASPLAMPDPDPDPAARGQPASTLDVVDGSAANGPRLGRPGR
jgi:hypothetical protein